MIERTTPYPPFWDKRKRDRTFQGLPLHVHDVHELCFLLSGSTKYFINNEFFILNAGEMAFALRGAFHQAEYNNTVDVDRIVFSFGDDFIGDDFRCFIEDMANKKHFVFDKQNLHEITALVNKIENEIQNNRPNSDKMLKLYFMQLLILISRYQQQSDNETLPSSMQFIKTVMNYIKDNCHTDISLEVLSDHFSISPSYLSKIFKSVTNLGVKEYINLCRIETAQMYLSTTNLSITKIATKCGFNNSNYFATVFKKINGITPKKYAMLYKKRL